MVASSIPCKISLCADRAHARAGDSYVSSAIDVACPTTQNVLAIASPHELQGDYWPSSLTGTSSFCCNQQYSITAVTTSAGSVTERYAYSAYGEPTICDPSGSTLSSSAINNRYTYTGREWDATVALYHFRARWMSPKTGRFLTRDPMGYFDGDSLYFKYFGLQGMDPTGLERLLDVPATPDKCAEALFYMKYYALLRSLGTYDNILLEHYLDSSGKDMVLDFSAFDYWGGARSTHYWKVLNAVAKAARTIPCNTTKSGMGTITGQFKSMTLMINTWTLTTNYSWSATKTCGTFCWMPTCDLKASIWFNYTAFDITDFNVGVGHTFGGGPIVPRITDDLIVACKIGRSFKISASSTDDASISGCAPSSIIGPSL